MKLFTARLLFEKEEFYPFCQITHIAQDDNFKKRGAYKKNILKTALAV
jgi:hypothetical protein